MNLADALLLENTSRLALVGAGGKTSAMFAAAKAFIQRRQAPRPILLTTTTHLAIEQCSLADHHFKIHSAEDVNARVSELNSGILLFTGTEEKDGRISGPDPQALEAIHTLADGLDCPLLVEADGSRLHPLKAPADFEPVIPEWVNHVLVCAGLAGLGEPLDAEIVHRPEIYAQLSGLVPGAPITPQAIVRVLRHSSGGLKAIPCHARRSVLLNQADTPEKQAAARRMADQLLGDYERVIISSLNLAVGDPVIHAAITPAAGIVLAAG
ncbi:MAG TPA: selenium cofactor biosynthesis protein YqeC, partial [Anaerolineales bacterium]|nr:selenium cofactor biosynthesis protein YqeC [Anaerolineales bacterium]